MKIRTVALYSLREPVDPKDPQHRDCLRYDRGFVCTVDPSLVAFPELVAGSKGVYPCGPTLGLWPSSLGLAKPRKGFDSTSAALAWANQDQWTTYRHPRNAEGAEDYARLVPVALAEVLAARDLDEVALRPPCANCGRPVRQVATDGVLRVWTHDDTDKPECRLDLGASSPRAYYPRRKR